MTALLFCNHLHWDWCLSGKHAWKTAGYLQWVEDEPHFQPRTACSAVKVISLNDFFSSTPQPFVKKNDYFSLLLLIHFLGRRNTSPRDVNPCVLVSRPHPARSFLQSQQAAETPAGPNQRSARRGWAGWGRNTRSCVASWPWMSRQGRAPCSSRSTAHCVWLAHLWERGNAFGWIIEWTRKGR